MRFVPHRVLSLTLICGLLAGCGDTADTGPLPPPATLTRDAVGHYCGMLVTHHEGPKGQIFVAGQDQPIWFSSVRDTIAFTLLPEETAKVRVIYVNDMARADDWASPGPGTWMDAREAHFVIGSSRTGGMGAQEAVPFSRRTAARAFVEQYGGQIVKLTEIPEDYVLGDAWDNPEKGGRPL